MFRRRQQKRKANPYDRHIGRRVRLIREREGRTLSECATRMGITHQQLQKIETGRGRLVLSDAAKLCRFLGVEMAEFLRDIEGWRPKRAANDFDIPEGVLIEHWRASRPLHRKALYVLLKDLRATSARGHVPRARGSSR